MMYFLGLFRITQACLDKKFITHHCANIDVYLLAPEKIVILGKVSQHAAGTSGLASKEIH